MLSNKTQKHFENKVIWVTGASSGIGRALVIMLSNIDCKIYISSRSEDNLHKTIAQCRDSNKKNIVVLAGDLTNKQVNQEILKNIEQTSGKLDIAVLNAGSCEYVDINNFDSSLFERQIKTNFLSMVYGIEAALPLLKKSVEAQLIGMSSTAAYLGLPRAEAYGATKAAIRNMFAALRVSLQAHKISSSVICPGFVETELTAKNDFDMPAMITAVKSAEYILNGIAKHKQEIHFPKRFSLTLKLIASLPNPVVSWLIRKTIPKSSNTNT
ncbi:MAG: SDR family NAD(P)-dependent oxidoreductase [Gammaproteobacteria bacterium]